MRNSICFVIDELDRIRSLMSRKNSLLIASNRILVYEAGRGQVFPGLPKISRTLWLSEFSASLI